MDFRSRPHVRNFLFEAITLEAEQNCECPSIVFLEIKSCLQIITHTLKRHEDKFEDPDLLSVKSISLTVDGFKTRH
jgi:hypothetical protein